MKNYGKVLRIIRDQDNGFEITFLPDLGENIILGIIKDGEIGYDIHLNLVDILLPTLTHECLHGIYPEKTERQIEKLTKKTLETLTRRQRKQIVVAWLCRISEVEQ